MSSDRVRQIVIVNFDKYNAPSKAINKEVREGGAMKWVRWEVGAHRDPDILDMPASQRFLWQTLVELAGTNRIDKNGNRVVRITVAQLARESNMPSSDVVAGLDHLKKHRRIRYTRDTARVAMGHPKGGEAPPNRHPKGGHVPTYVPTDLRTDGEAAAKAASTKEDRAAWVSDPTLRALLEARLARRDA